MVLLPIFAVLFASTFEPSYSSTYVYKKTAVPVVSCISNPVQTACPSVSHKVPDLSIIGESLPVANKTFIDDVINTISNLTVDESCKTATKDYVCTWLLPVCDENSDLISLFNEKTKQTCENVAKSCNKWPTDSLPNCTAPEAVPKKVPRRHICEKFPEIKNDPYPCENINYKVPEEVKNNTAGLLEAHKALKNESRKLDESCVNVVAEVMCNLFAPACAKRRNYLFDLLSKEDCDNKLKCLDGKASDQFKRHASQACFGFVSNKAEKFKAAEVVDYLPVSEAASLKMATKFLLFAVLAFMGIFI